MERNCSTCKKRGPDNKCSEGDSAEVYCMGGDFELWVGESVIEEQLPVPVKQPEPPNLKEMAENEGILKPDKDDEKVLEEASNAANFTPPEIPYGKNVREMANMTIEKMEAELGRPMTEPEKKQFEIVQAQAKDLEAKLNSGEITEADLQKALDPEQQKLYQAMRETLQNIENRPTTDEEGFNGVKRDGILKSKTCEGCRHRSMVGCFLGRYYDCVDHGRYLFEPLADGKHILEGIEEKEERVEDEQDIDYIDGILDDREKRTQ